MCNTTSSLNCHLTCFWKQTGKCKGICFQLVWEKPCFAFYFLVEGVMWGSPDLKVVKPWVIRTDVCPTHQNTDSFYSGFVALYGYFFSPPSSCCTPTSWNRAVKWSACYFLLHTLRWVSGSCFKYIFLRFAWWSVKASPPPSFSHRLELIYTCQTKQNLCIRLSE